MNDENIKLSASKIKTLESCSFIYYAVYHLKLPKTSNTGSNRGLICHGVLESLLNPRRINHYNSIIQDNTITKNKGIYALVKKHAKKLGIDDEENLQMIDEMILIALKNDFFCKGNEKIEAEKEFSIKNENYSILGFVDKTAHFKDEIKIYDYKTSKIKFSKKEIQTNVQALMYSLACYINYKVIPTISFIFLRFPKAPIQEVRKCTLLELKGFEKYLEALTKELKNFSPIKAKSNLAINSPDRRWLCGRNKTKDEKKEDGSPVWGCPFKFAFDYFALLDEKGKVLKTAFNKKELLAAENQKIKKLKYAGCPAFNKSQVLDF